MDVRLPNGTVIKNVPEGTTKKQLLDKLQSKGFNVKQLTTPKAAKAEEVPAAPAAPEESFGQRVLGAAASTADIVAESAPGMAAMVAYPFRRAASVVTGETPEEIEASLGRVTGAVSAPVGRMLGVTDSPSYKNNLAKQALEYVGTAMNDLATTVSGQTGIPEPDVRNMMQVVTSALPVKVPGSKTITKATRAGITKVQDVFDPKTKFYMDVAEGKGDALIAAARDPAGEIVPGVRPTFAQATADVGLPRVAAVGKQAEELQPTAAIAKRDAQEAARVGELKAIEQTPAAREKASLERARASDPLFQAAENAGDVVDVKPVLKSLDTLVKENPGNQPLLRELAEIRKGLTRPTKKKVATVTPSGKVKMVEQTVMAPRVNAKEISSTIDGIKSAMANEDNRFILKQLSQIKDSLTEAIPSLKEANEAFKKGSAPVNQMDVGKYLRQKLESAVPEGTQRAGVFAEAVRNAPLTIKRAIDNKPRYTELTEVLTPEQQTRVDRVLMDLSRDARVKELAQLGNKIASLLKEPAGKMTLPPLLDRAATIINEILKRLEGKVNEKLAMEIALEFLDADRAAAALETAMARAEKRANAPRAAKPPKSPVKRAIQRSPIATAPNQMNNEENRNRMAR